MTEMDHRSLGMVFDLNQPPLSSPRETVTEHVNDDDDDVVIIEHPELLIGERNGAAVPAPAVDGATAGTTIREEEGTRLAEETGGAAIVFCTGCRGEYKPKFNGTPEQLRQWKCFKCLLKKGAAIGTAGYGGGAGGGGLGLLDINASPPREGEAEAEGGCSGPVDDVASLTRRVGDRNRGDKVQAECHSSFSAHPVSLLSTYSNMWPAEKRFDLLKPPQISTDISRLGYDDIVDHRTSSGISLNRIDLGSTDDGRPEAHKPTLTDCYPQTPNEVYLQGLREYIAERKGVLSDGWHVEFVFCNNRLKTFPVYHAPDGRRFESMSDVARHLGLPSNSHPIQSENVDNEVVKQNGTYFSQRRKESSGSMRVGNSQQRLNILRSSSSQRVSSSGVDCTNGCQDGFPIQLEDFYLISAGVIDLRPSYHSTNLIWPVGYRSIWHDKSTGSLFVFDVTDGGDSGPNFMVQRYPCTAQTIPLSSTVLSRSKLGSLNGEDNLAKDDSTRFCTIDEESISIQMMLTEFSPPHLDDDISSRKTGNDGIDSEKANLPSSDSFCQSSGNLTSDIFGLDSVGEFLVEGRSPSFVWEKVCKTFFHACYEAYKQKGKIQFGCDHEVREINVKELDNLDPLSKFSHLVGPMDVPKLIQSDHEFQSTCELVAKWLQQDRFGLDAEFVQEVIEQLPGVTGCSEYSLLSNRKQHSSLQTVRSGFLQLKRKSDINLGIESDGYSYSRSSKRPRQHSKHSELRGPFPVGKPLCSRLPTYLIGDALQVWEFSWRFCEVLGLEEPFSFQELEEELINPWLDVLNPLEKLGTGVLDSGDVSSRSSREVSQARVSSHSCRRCTGIVLAKSHGSLLKVLAGELLSKVAVYVDPNFDAGESKSRRGRKKDPDYSTSVKKKLDLMPVNELTWPEIARRYILAVLSMDGNLDSSEIACRESGKVFHCLQGDGGTLCGSLTGVAALEADALLLAEATKKIFGSPKATNEALSRDQNESDAADVSKRIEVNDSEVPEWAQVLEPVRKLPTNVGARIRRCVHEALQRNPPEWAKKKLEHSISKEVYKGNASGPTKRAVVEVLTDVSREKLQQKPEKKEKSKSVKTLSDLTMKQCRIVLRRAVTADEDKVFCNLLGRTLLNPNDNDDEGLLGHPAMVSRPLDFRTIDLRLAAGAYGGSHEAFADDVREVWQNVRNAYSEQSDLIGIAETLSQQFEDLYEKEVLTLIQKTTVSASVNCSGSESEKERDDILAFVRESSLPRAPWDEGICKVCGMDKDDDNVLLCDNCDSEYHTYCLSPPLIRIPEGNWYCPSCVAGQSLHQSAAYGTQVVYRFAKRRYQREYVHKVLEMLTQLAKTMELKEYWEFTLEERIFLMKFLCDEALSSAVVHDHIDKCASMSVDLQQKLRSLNSERKILKSREESLAANMAKTKSTSHTSGGEWGLNGLASVATDESKLHDGEKISDFSGGSMQMEASSSISQLKHLQSERDGQNLDNLRSDVDLHQKLGNSSSVSVQSTGNIMPGHNLSGTADKNMGIHISLVQGDQCSNQANASSSHECNAELSNLQNEISGLHDSIDTVESELLKVSVRKEFLGRDSYGRLYWVFARPGTCPWLLVNGILNAEQEFGPGSLFPNFTSWMSYNTVTKVEELVNWLDDSDVRERELKESILLWQSNKSLDTNDVGNDILNRGRPVSSMLCSGETAADPDFLVTKAVRALEKKFGPCLEMWTNDIYKNLAHEGKITYEGRMYRCECLELLWTSRHHCFSCHKTFCTNEELTQHTGEKCKVVPVGGPESQITEGPLKHKKMARNQPVEKCSGNLSIFDLCLNEKRDNRPTFLQGPPEPECPFNFEEIKAKFRTEDSLKELVKEIGLIGSNGIVSFVPSPSPFLNDPVLTFAPGRDNEVSLGDVPSVPESQWKVSDDGANVQSANNKIPDYFQSIKNGKGEVVAEVERMKPPVLSESGQFSLTKDRSSVLGVWKSCIIRESSLRPKVGKASEVLRLLKINLLDMDAALPEDALRSSRSHLDRRCAWRKYVKSANSLYEMVQAIIILEDTIKTDYLRKDWWYWSTPSAAVNISTLSALALRIYTLDSAILYEKPCSSDDTAEIVEADFKSDKEVAQSSVPSNNFRPGDQPMPKMADSDSGENSRPRTRTSKRKKGSGG